LVAFCALTPLFLIVGHLATVSDFYLSDGEWAALKWLREKGDPDAVVLCSPRMGLLVPAWAGQPVVYGHPFETVNAARRKAEVEAYWAGEMGIEEQEAFLRENRVGYVLLDQETKDWESETWEWELVSEGENVKVYRLGY